MTKTLTLGSQNQQFRPRSHGKHHDLDTQNCTAPGPYSWQSSTGYLYLLHRFDPVNPIKSFLTLCTLHVVLFLLHTHPFNGRLSETTRVSWYKKGKTNQDYTGARDSEWQWHPLGHMQVCTSLQTDNHASTPPLSFLQARCPSCRPTNGVSVLKALLFLLLLLYMM